MLVFPCADDLLLFGGCGNLFGKKGQVEFVTTEAAAAAFRRVRLSCMYTARNDDNMRSQYTR